MWRLGAWEEFLNRLTRENNAQLGKTYTYTYDNVGNITSKKTYAYTVGTLGSVQSTKTYTYGNSNWGDQLTAYNGATITYDDSGNPLTYNNGSSYTFTWTAGRRLASATKGTTSLSFKYNESGIRTTKTVGTVVHEYTLDGTKIVAEKWGVNGVTHLVEYIYDANSVIGMIYHNNTMSVDSFEQYVFEKNLQGDIVAVYNATGTKLVAYTYDAWGNVTTTYYNGGASTGAQYNSLRYRGYYYDTETGLYYVSSRYYDPEIGRFINADGFVSTGQDITGYNMFAYCGNNPVNRVDPSGCAWYNVVWDWFNTIVGFLNPISSLTSIGTLTVAAVQGRTDEIKEDFNNGCLNPFNQSEDIALKSKVLSFYKGSTVVRQNVVGTCSIGGTIWSESNINKEDLKHEYGHSIQERFMGSTYLLTIAAPSAIYCWYDDITNGSDINYYSMPWERTADWLGGVNRSCGYKTGSLAWAIAENVLGPVAIPVYFLFGY